MKKTKKNNPIVETRGVTSLQVAEKYTAPEIEVIDIEISQNILGGSTESNPLPNMPFNGW